MNVAVAAAAGLADGCCVAATASTAATDANATTAGKESKKVLEGSAGKLPGRG